MTYANNRHQQLFLHEALKQREMNLISKFNKQRLERRQKWLKRSPVTQLIDFFNHLFKKDAEFTTPVSMPPFPNSPYMTLSDYLKQES